MMFRILAWLLGRRVIVLESHSGWTYQTWERFNGKVRYAPVYPIMGVGRVLLLPDGRVREPHFVKEWWYADDMRGQPL